MARFDVYRYGKNMLLLDVQADLLSDLKTRVVVPLVSKTKAGKEMAAPLKPLLIVKGKPFVLVTTDIGVVKTSDFGAFLDNIADQRQPVVRALDFLFQGF